jgi:hypothetical protein
MQKLEPLRCSCRFRLRRRPRALEMAPDEHQLVMHLWINPKTPILLTHLEAYRWLRILLLLLKCTP